MKQQRNVRSVQTINLGLEQLVIIVEPDQQVGVLFRGEWLREPAPSRIPVKAAR